METNQNTVTEKETPKFRLNLNLEIPKRSVWALIVLVPLLLFTYFQFKFWVIPELQYAWEIKKEDVTFSLVMRGMWVPISAALMINLIILKAIEVFKSINQKALKWFLTAGCATGFLAGALIILVMPFANPEGHPYAWALICPFSVMTGVTWMSFLVKVDPIKDKEEVG